MVSANSFMDFSHDIVYVFGAKTSQVRMGKAPFVQNAFD